MGGNEILNRVSLDKIKKYYYLERKRGKCIWWYPTRQRSAARRRVVSILSFLMRNWDCISYKELDGCELTLVFRQVRAAQERNTLRPVLYVLSLTMKGVDGMMMMMMLDMCSMGPLRSPL